LAASFLPTATSSDLAARAKKIFVDRVLDSVETLIEQRRRAR
jgi:hypothetical protein